MSLKIRVLRFIVKIVPLVPFKLLINSLIKIYHGKFNKIPVTNDSTAL